MSSSMWRRQRMSVILTVEDEFFISEYLRLLLEQAGHDVVTTYKPTRQ